MTAQIQDKFIFNGDIYSLIGIKGSELFSPEKFGMMPFMIHTACYRGFFATYELAREALYLRDLTINEANQNYPPIGGVEPTKIIEYGRELPQRAYYGLNLIVPFTGKIRLAKDFVQELYVHMGFQKPSAFKTVLDVALDAGKVMEIKDRSHDVEQIRGAFKEYYQSGDTTNEKLEEAFSLDMGDLK